MDAYPHMDERDINASLTSHEPAWERMVHFVNKHPNKINFLVTGPVTNLARAIDLDPEFGNKIDRLVLMGGCFPGSGNITK